MPCFGSIGSYKGTFVIASKYFAFIFVPFYCTVEEDYRDPCCRCLVHDCLGSIYGTGSYDVNDQKVCPSLDSCVDLLVLCGLVAVGVIVLVGNSQGI